MSKTSCVCPSPRLILQGTLFHQDTEPSYHFKLFSIPSMTSFVRLLTCGEQPCRMQQEKLTRNWTINRFQHTQKAQICFYHLYPEESWLRSGARKNRYVMLGKISLCRTPRGTDWPEGENSACAHTHKSYDMPLSTFFAIFAGFNYQINYQNLKDKVKLLPPRWHRSKTEGFLSWFGLGVNVPVSGAGSTLENMDQHPHFAEEEMEGQGPWPKWQRCSQDGMLDLKAFTSASLRPFPDLLWLSFWGQDSVRTGHWEAGHFYTAVSNPTTQWNHLGTT